MRELTELTPKPMLKLAGRNLIEHKLDILPDEIDEVIIVVGYKDHIIKDYFKDKYRDKIIKYAYQKELLGTAKSVWEAKEFIRDRFIVMMGDDIYSVDVVNEMIKFDWALGIQKVEKEKIGAEVVFDENGHLIDIKESQKLLKDRYENIGLYMLDRRFFEYEPVKKSPGAKEYGLPQTILTAKDDIDIKIVKSSNWFPLSSPEDLEETEKIAFSC